MNTNGKQHIAAMFMPLEIVRRNLLSFVQAQLRARETSRPIINVPTRAERSGHGVAGGILIIAGPHETGALIEYSRIHSNHSRRT